MAITSEHLMGFAAGLGAAAIGFYVYKKNQVRVDDWLRRQGIQLSTGAPKDVAAMSLEELVREKERLEDVIAEREMAAGSATAAEPA